MDSLSKTGRITITRDTLLGISFVFFFAQDVIRVAIGTIMPISSDALTWLIIILMYFPIFMSVVLGGLSDNWFVFRFFILLVIVSGFFAITYSIHPEYEYWFFKSSYSIGKWIFRPNQYLYAFLFVSAIDDPKYIIKLMKIVVNLLLIYYTYKLMQARSVGYWITTTTAAGPQKASYDLSYGYKHLIVFSTFACVGFREKNKLYAIPCVISIVEILLGGSRGPLLGIGVALILLYLFHRTEMSKSIRVIVLTGVAFVISLWLLLGVNGIMVMAGKVLSVLTGNSSSRTVEMLKNAQGTEDNGRLRLYKIAFGMIKDGFWGYGAYGDRYVIGRTFWVGYTHNIILEMLIDFGWILGGLFCIRMAVHSIKLLRKRVNKDWRDLYFIFFIPCLKLLLSGSFWFSYEFWAAIAVFYMYKRWNKNMKCVEMVA